MKGFSQEEFRLRVKSGHFGHDLRASLGVENVCHSDALIRATLNDKNARADPLGIIVFISSQATFAPTKRSMLSTVIKVRLPTFFLTSVPSRISLSIVVRPNPVACSV